MKKINAYCKGLCEESKTQKNIFKNLTNISGTTLRLLNTNFAPRYVQTNLVCLRPLFVQFVQIILNISKSM
jgi:hypothetical protein